MAFWNDNNAFKAFMNEEPEAAYFSYQNQWNTPNAKRYFQSQFGNIQNQYMGQLGQLIRGGGEPTLNFPDFLTQFPWQQTFQDLPPRQRGMEQGQFNPFTRWVPR